MLTCRPRISNSEPFARFFASSEWTSSSLNSHGIAIRPASHPRSAAVTTIPAPTISQPSRTRPTLSGPLVRLAHAPALRDGQGRDDQGEVRERLRKVPELALGDR